MEKKLVIRRATKEDKDRVLNIHGHVYDGHDYLPAYYDHFLSSTDFIPFVMILDGQTIGYEVLQKVDDGQTLVGRAGRVNPKYERQGFVKQFSASMAEWRGQNNIRRIAFTATDGNPATARSSFQSLNRLVLTRQMPLYFVDVLNTTLNDKDIRDAMKLKTVTEADISSHFSSKKIKDYLSPEGHMIIDMVPLRMINSNIHYMTGPNGYTAVYSDIRIENGQCRGLLSFGTVFPVKRPPFHNNLDIFGSDTATLKEHIVRHLMFMRQKGTGVVGVLAMVQEDFDMLQLDKVFEDFGVKRKIWYDSTYPNLKYSQLYLYEREAHSSKY